MRAPRKPQHAALRAGFTLVEFLACVAVVSLLLVLLLPAIQYARESARQVQCRNNLRQIGAALHTFHDQHQFLDTVRTLSVILPAMGEAPLKDLRDAIDEAIRLGKPVPRVPTPSPASYICPSDSNASRAAMNVNYAINFGANFRRDSGIYRYFHNDQIRFSEITDGLSNTALYAEKLTSFINKVPVPQSVCRASPLRCFWISDVQFTFGDEQKIYEHCIDPIVRANAESGFWQVVSLFGDSHRYDHFVPPQNWSFGSLGQSDGPLPPSSQHGDGVHILFGDGSVKFVSQHIDYKVFWSQGTIASQEVAHR